MTLGQGTVKAGLASTLIPSGVRSADTLKLLLLQITDPSSGPTGQQEESLPLLPSFWVFILAEDMEPSCS